MWTNKVAKQQLPDEAVPLAGRIPTSSALDLPTLNSLQADNERLRRALSEAHARIIELERLADSDTLTPLPNRRRFLRELEQTIERVRNDGSAAALLFIDVDRLKTINDTRGHGTGDAALLHIARILMSQVDSTDMVARLGGDEFGVLLCRQEQQDAADKAEALIRLVAMSPLDCSPSLSLSISVGLSPVDGIADAATLLARADAAMYAGRAGQSRSER